MKSTSGFRTAAGHTLIELCLVLGVVGLLLAGSLGRPFGHEVRTVRGAHLLGQFVANLAERARTVGLTGRVEFARSSDRVRSCFEIVSNQACPAAPAQELLLPKGILIESTRFAGAESAQTLRLYPSGAASAGRIILRNMLGESCVIVISLWSAQTIRCSTSA